MLEKNIMDVSLPQHPSQLLLKARAWLFIIQSGHRAEETIQLVKCIECKHEDLSSDPKSPCQTKVAELLGEGDGRKTMQEGPGDSVKFEGGEDASVAVEWSGVSLLIALPCPVLLAPRNSEVIFLQVGTRYQSPSLTS